MEKITYGAPRLVDWVAQIKAGAATVRVHFTGGALTSYGVTPAEYTTDNPFLQKVIEQSSYYKEGRIIRLRSMTVADKPKPTKPTKAKPKQPTAPTAKPAEETAEEVATPTPAPVAPAPVESTPEETSAEEPQQPAEETAEEANNGMVTVEVTCLQDAHAYLQENFNISSYKVRSYEAAQRAAAEHGVKFAGAKFDTLNSGEDSESETEQEEE